MLSLFYLGNKGQRSLCLQRVPWRATGIWRTGLACVGTRAVTACTRIPPRPEDHLLLDPCAAHIPSDEGKSTAQERPTRRGSNSYAIAILHLGAGGLPCFSPDLLLPRKGPLEPGDASRPRYDRPCAAPTIVSWNFAYEGVAFSS
jgi:hypothetical protein